MSQPPETIAIIGGGIAGLAAAYRAATKFPTANISLFESSSEFGGVLKTEHVDGYLIEHSADMFTTDPPFALELCRELGREAELVQTIATSDRAFVATQDSIHPVPRGLSLMLPTDLEAILSSPLLDDESKKRFLEEENVAARDSDEDESFQSFTVRRFGQSAFENLFQPLVSGIYTADPTILSMKATISRFLEMEKKHGSLIAAGAARKKASSDNAASGARYGIFRAPAKGMGDLVRWLTEALANNNKIQLRTDCQIDSILQIENPTNENEKKQWSLAISAPVETLIFDAVVVATAASVSSSIIRDFSDTLAQKLEAVSAASSAIVVLGFDRGQMNADFRGYGIIDPSVLKRNVIATSFASNKFAGRAPEEKVLTRTFIGGALQANLVDLDDDALIEIAVGELSKTVGFRGDPEISRVFRWKNCMPQYHLGHAERVEAFESEVAKIPSLEFCGKSFRGVGIPACIQSGYEAVDRLTTSSSNFD